MSPIATKIASIVIARPESFVVPTSRARHRITRTAPAPLHTKNRDRSQAVAKMRHGDSAIAMSAAHERSLKLVQRGEMVRRHRDDRATDEHRHGQRELPWLIGEGARHSFEARRRS